MMTAAVSATAVKSAAVACATMRRGNVMVMMVRVCRYGLMGGTAVRLGVGLIQNDGQQGIGGIASAP